MHIICLGLSHHHTPVCLREQVAFEGEVLTQALHHFHQNQAACYPDISELLILSTCNRIELYAICHPTAKDHFARLSQFLVDTRAVNMAELEPYLYVYESHRAINHLHRVAAGLDSMVLGESQILGQVNQALQQAQAAQTAHDLLPELIRSALKAGKRARSETDIERNPTSVGSVAVRVAQESLNNLNEAHVLIIGAGEMGELTAEALYKRGVKHIAIANRTLSRAEALAHRWHGRAYSLNQLAQALAWADVVITSTGAPNAIIRPQHLVDRDRPLTLIDLAVPRDVDPAVAQLPQINLIDIDALEDRLQTALAERQRQVPQVEAIVSATIANFETWLKQRELAPLISELRHKAEAIRQNELERVLGYLPDADPEVQQQLQKFSRALVNKLLHEPTLCLRHEATGDRALEYADTVRHLFGLNQKASVS